MELPKFTPSMAYLLLVRVYVDHSHHKNGSHLDRGVQDDSVWQYHWRRMVVQLARWYYMPQG